MKRNFQKKFLSTITREKAIPTSKNYIITTTNIQRKNKKMKEQIKAIHRKKEKIIIVEGNISAGKSTLCKELAKKEHLNASVFIEPALENPYLNKFYENPKKYALTLQMYILKERYTVYREALKIAMMQHRNVILDRSIFSDIVFAAKNYKDGNISEKGYQYYMKVREAMMKKMPLPAVTLYLDVTPEECQYRITKMRGRACEAAIPIDYLKGLEDAYQDMLKEMEDHGSITMTENWNAFGDAERIKKNIEKALKKQLVFVNDPISPQAIEATIPPVDKLMNQLVDIGTPQDELFFNEEGDATENINTTTSSNNNNNTTAKTMTMDTPDTIPHSTEEVIMDDYSYSQADIVDELSNPSMHTNTNHHHASTSTQPPTNFTQLSMFQHDRSF